MKPIQHWTQGVSHRCRAAIVLRSSLLLTILCDLLSLGQRGLFQGLVEQPDHGTIIFVTHRLEALQWADKVVVIEDGQITAFGTPQETSAEVCKVFDLSKDDKYGYAT